MGLTQLLDVLQTNIQAAVNLALSGTVYPPSFIGGTFPPGFTVTVKEGWIGQQELRQILEGNNAAITIFDTGTEKDDTRYISKMDMSDYVLGTPSVAITPYITRITGLSVVQYTLSLINGFLLPTPGDAVAMSMAEFAFNSFAGVVYTVQIGDTLNMVTANLAALFNNNPALAARATAVASGNNIILTASSSLTNGSSASADFTVPPGQTFIFPSAFSILGSVVVTIAAGALLIVQDYLRLLPAYVYADASTQAYILQEVGRTKKLMQIDCWAPSHEVRDLLMDFVDSYMMQFRYSLGLQMENGQFARITYAKSILDDSKSERGLFRRISYYWMEIPMKFPLPAYQVLITQFTKVICNSAGLQIFQEN